LARREKRNRRALLRSRPLLAARVEDLKWGGKKRGPLLPEREEEGPITPLWRGELFFYLSGRKGVRARLDRKKTFARGGTAALKEGRYVAYFFGLEKE